MFCVYFQNLCVNVLSVYELKLQFEIGSSTLIVFKLIADSVLII